MDGLTYGFNIIIETKSLTYFELSKSNELRLILILQLHKSGLSSRGICDYLIQNNILTPRGHRDYTPHLIWITLKKYQERLDRIESVDIEIGPDSFFIKSGVKSWKK